MSTRAVRLPGAPKKKTKLTEKNGYRVGQYVDWFPSRLSIAKKHQKIPGEVIGFTNTRILLMVYIPGMAPRLCQTEFDSIQHRKESYEDKKKEITKVPPVFQEGTSRHLEA